MKKEIDNDYKLIPMADIDDEAREIAVRWMECDDKNWIGQKHKLASDIMNYARRKAKVFSSNAVLAVSLPTTDKWFDLFNDRHPDEVAQILKEEEGNDR